MADSTEGTSDPQVTFKVKTSGDRQHTITMTETATVSDLKNKLSGADFEDIPIERQRLIYSGRVMKNEEPLSTYKIKNGNTVHLVKSAASNPKPAPASSSASSTPAIPQIPTNMAAGTANNPLAGLTGARYAGLTNLPSADMFGPDGGMVGSMMDEDQLANMLNNPNVAQQMNEMMNNDTFIDMMINSNPMLRNNPNAREIVRSPLFRHMMTNPEALRSAARLQRAMGGRQASQNAFPMPGVTDNTPGGDAAPASSSSGNDTASANQAGAPPNPFDPALWGNIQLPGSAGGAGGNAAANPFGAFFNPFSMGQPGQGAAAASGAPPATGGAQTEGSNATATPGQGQGATSPNAAGQPPNPFASLFGGNPFGGLGGAGAGAGAGTGAGAGANPGANLFGGMPPMSPEALQQMVQMLGMNSPSGSPAPPPDNRPPEERYAEQLRQLNDMGFYDFDRNVAALRRSGGSVQGAVEHLLSS
ncbi:ubiquitin-domain-containing protein [Hypoxylon sp. FL1150]|nr:ubiquitin-domain-containing protein [Hypoxylon sp. FL1150]